MAIQTQTTSNIMENSHRMIKTVAAGVVAAAIDWKYFNRQNWQESAYFGLSAAAGINIGDMVGENLSAVIPSADNGYISGKTLLRRVLEVGAGTGISTLTNMYILKNSYNQEEIPMRMIIVAGSDFAGEYFADWFSSQPLSYLQ